MEDKIDAILKIIYDKNLLLFNRVSSLDIISFGKEKFNLTLTTPEIVYVIDLLENEGYLKVVKHDDGKPNEFALTVNGIKLAQSGGMKSQIVTNKRKQRLINYGTIAVIISGLYYGIEILIYVIPLVGRILSLHCH